MNLLGGIVISFAVIINIKFVISINHTQADSLELVFAVFRHGFKTTAAPYPKDPRINATYYPYGRGQLTNQGKRRVFQLGKMLRERYKDFLGSIYTPDILFAVTAESDRSKMSIELILASLFPPFGTEQAWSNVLNWQPIPYHCLQKSNDFLLTYPSINCKKFKVLHKQYLNSDAGQKIEEKYSKLFPYIAFHTGLRVSSIHDILALYFRLKSEEELGLELPSWTRLIFPEYLNNLAIDFYNINSASTELKQLSGGFLLKEIVTDASLKIERNLIPQTRKLFLYSGHKHCIISLMYAMEINFPHIPTYGACIMIELHKTDGIYNVKIFYYNHTSVEPAELVVPGCENFCSFHKFVNLLQKNLPLNNDVCNIE